MIKFYSALAWEINSLYNVSVDDQGIERFIENGFLTFKEEFGDPISNPQKKAVDLSFIDAMLSLVDLIGRVY